MSKKQTPETRLKNEIMLYCGEHNYTIIRLNSGKAWNGELFNSPEYKLIILNPKPIKLATEGTSDLLIIMPNKIAFIETKIHPRKPTVEQLNFIARMRELGHIAGVVYSVDEFKSLIENNAL